MDNRKQDGKATDEVMTDDKACLTGLVVDIDILTSVGIADGGFLFISNHL